jgi:hypothetical protein
MELTTMQNIRTALVERIHPEIVNIAPTQIVVMHDLLPNPMIAEKFKRLKQRAYLGDQYEWLACYADQFSIAELELCIHVDDKAYHFIHQHVEINGDGLWRLKADHASADVSIFSEFVFPILNLSKIEMEEQARARGFYDIMLMTWFCHNPIQNQPCGRCAPCRYMIEEGMGYRLPSIARMRYRVNKMLHIIRK